jgi:hypothetical protein
MRVQAQMTKRIFGIGCLASLRQGIPLLLLLGSAEICGQRRFHQVLLKVHE